MCYGQSDFENQDCDEGSSAHCSASCEAGRRSGKTLIAENAKLKARVAELEAGADAHDSVSATIEISDGHHITKAAYSTIRPLTPEGALELAGLLVAGAKAIGS